MLPLETSWATSRCGTSNLERTSLSGGPLLLQVGASSKATVTSAASLRSVFHLTANRYSLLVWARCAIQWLATANNFGNALPGASHLLKKYKRQSLNSRAKV